MPDETTSSPDSVSGGSWPPAGQSFDIAKAAFSENFAQYRHLNEQMNKVPAFAVTLTGGIWYVAVVADYGDNMLPHLEQLARWALMILGATCNFALVFVAIRIRTVMSGYQDSVARFETSQWWPAEERGSRFRDYSMISMYSVLILAAGAVSLLGAFILFWPTLWRSQWWMGAGAVVFAWLLLILLSSWLPTWLTRTPKQTTGQPAPLRKP